MVSRCDAAGQVSKGEGECAEREKILSSDSLGMGRTGL